MKILLADDHTLFREGMRHVVAQLADAQAAVTVVEARDWCAALAMVVDHPDLALALVDLQMPGMESFAGLEALLQHAETIPVVVVSGSESLVDMKRVLDAGAMGYIGKSEAAAVVVGALRLVLAGGIYVPPRLVQPAGLGQTKVHGPLPFGLTPKQYAVLKELLRGKSNHEISQTLKLSIATVKAHLGAVYKSLQVSTREEAIRVVAESGKKIDT